MVYQSDRRERLFSGHTGRLFVALTFIFVCVKLTQRLLPPLLPAIMDDLAISAFLAGVALTVLRLARAVTQYPGGRLADRLTRTTVLLASLGVVIVSMAVLSLAVTYGMLLGGLVLFGVGLALFIPASRALLSDVFDEKRGRAFGLHTMGSDLAGILAAGIAVWLVAIATWRGAFLPLLVVLLPLPVVLYAISREPVRVESVDLGLRETGMRLLGDPSMRWLLVVYALFQVASSGVVGFLPTFLIEVHGVSFAYASSAFALVYGVGLVTRPIAGAASDTIPRPIVAGGSLALAGGGVAILTAAPVGAAVVVGVMVYAIGQRGMPPAMQAYLMDRFPDENMGGDFGAVRGIYMAAGSLGPGYTGFVAGTLGFVVAYATLVGFFLAGAAILGWFTVRGWPSAGSTG